MEIIQQPQPSIEISTTQRAIEESDFELNHDAVSIVLEQLGMPKDVKVKLVGDLANVAPSNAQIVGDTTFHYLPVLPRHSPDDKNTASESPDRAKISWSQTQAAYRLVKVAEHHIPELEDVSVTPRKHPLAAAALISIWAANSVLVREGAEATCPNPDLVSAGPVITTAAIGAYAFRKYREAQYIQDEKRAKKDNHNSRVQDALKFSKENAERFVIPRTSIRQSFLRTN